MLYKYVDNINMATEIIPIGYHWEDVSEDGKILRRLRYSEEMEDREKEG